MAKQQHINPENIYVVLSHPKGPINIGSTARAMNNMGIRDLVLVNPCEYQNEEARRMASGCNDTLLGARVFNSTEEAVKEAGYVVGLTCRKGEHRQNVATPAELANHLTAISQDNRVALLFGTERTGLNNEEVSLCNLLVTIPTSTLNPSLNLAQAVLLTCYEIFKASNEALFCEETAEPAKLATSEETELMYAHMEEVFGRIGYLNPENPGHIMMTIRNIFARTNLDSRDVKILRGMIGKIDCYRKWVDRGRIRRGKKPE